MEIEAPKTDFYIRLQAEADMPEALAAFYRQDSHTEISDDGVTETVLDGDPYLVTHSADYAIDVVGVLQEPTGNMLTDEDGNEYPETAPLPGWHVNIRLLGESRRADVEALDAAHGVTPTAPRRVWL